MDYSPLRRVSLVIGGYAFRNDHVSKGTERESRQNKRQPGGVSWRDSVTVWVLCQPGSGHRPGRAEEALFRRFFLTRNGSHREFDHT